MIFIIVLTLFLLSILSIYAFIYFNGDNSFDATNETFAWLITSFVFFFFGFVLFSWSLFNPNYVVNFIENILIENLINYYTLNGTQLIPELEPKIQIQEVPVDFYQVVNLAVYLILGALSWITYFASIILIHIGIYHMFSKVFMKINTLRCSKQESKEIINDSLDMTN